MLRKKEKFTYKNKKGVTELFGNSILFQEKKYNSQSVFAKQTTLNVQSSKYIFTYFNVNYEIFRTIVLKTKRGKFF